MSTSTTLLINKRDSGQWEGIRKGAGRASFLKDTKKEAVKEGNRYLYEYDDVKKMIIHKGNGEVDRTKKAPKKKVTSSYKDDITTKDIEISDFILAYKAWEEKSDREKLTDKDIGSRVHIAGEKGTTKTYLREIHKPGDPQFPDGGYSVQWKKKDYITHHFYDEVRLHQSEVRRRIREGN